jgi:demethylmacrocin O-methyltransferase
MDRLTEIANHIGTDKGTTAFCGHSYTITYNELFEPLITGHVKMLEIGVADPRFPGASLKMWKEYFTDLEFVGYDINPDAKQFEQENMKVFIGDQNSSSDLAKCIEIYGAEFDIIMDDGSHHSEHILTSFKYLFPHLKSGGYYIIEDLHSVYSNAAFTIPEVSNIIEQEQFNIKHLSNRHNGKMIVINKA